MKQLEGKVAIVTGSSSGMGRSTARLFAANGAKVAVTAVQDVTGGEETVKTIQSAGGEAFFLQADVSSAADVERLVAAAVAAWGKIDILANCAGVFMKGKRLENVTEEFWDRLFAVNVKGLFLTAKNVIPLMKSAGSGVIINIASSIVARPAPFHLPYACTKGAVVALTKALALELAPFGIRANYICPGLTDTPMVELFSEADRRTFPEIIPLHRLVEPDEVAAAALYLASGEASILTGAGIAVDGGLAI